MHEFDPPGEGADDRVRFEIDPPWDRLELQANGEGPYITAHEEDGGPRSLSSRSELNKYFEGGYGTADGLLIVPSVPRLLGGLKSLQFIVAEQHASLDTPPDPESTLDINDAIIDPQGWGDLVDFAKRVESQADGQYAAALFEVRQMVEDARGKGAVVRELFVPDTVPHASEYYFNRLTRLAQDAGLPVVIRAHSWDDDIQDQYTDFMRFEPPTAVSIEAYWEEREQAYSPPRLIMIPPEAADADVVASLAQLKLTASDTENGRAVLDHLITVSRANPRKLQAWLLGADSEAKAALRVINELAYGIDYSRSDFWQDRETRVAARVIVAKLQEGSGFTRLKSELQQSKDGKVPPRKIVVPFGIYLRHSPELRAEVGQQITRLLQGSEADVARAMPLVGGLCYSYDLSAGPFAASLIARAATGDETWVQTTVQPMMEWLPGYIDVVQAGPESVQKDQTLEIIGEQLAAFMHGLQKGIISIPDSMSAASIAHNVGDMLLKLRDPAHQGVLRTHLLQSFAGTGSVLQRPETHETAFGAQYMQYRKLYGDLPEISRLIQIK